MIKYQFVTDWTFRAPVERVWALVKEPETIVSWWPEIKECKIRGQHKDIAKGTTIDAAVKGILYKFNFNLEVIGIKPKKELRLKSSGDLEGMGLLTLIEEGDLTRVKYIWQVSTTGLWINVLGIFLKPLLIWSHNKAMDSGYKALKSRIE